MSSDCAKARVGLCTGVTLCAYPSRTYSALITAVLPVLGVVAAVLDKDCPILEPVVPRSEGKRMAKAVSFSATLCSSGRSQISQQ